MKRIFVCDTAFQVFNCCNLAYHSDRSNCDTDICIVDQFQNANELCKKIEETKMFHKVYLIKRLKSLRCKPINWAWMLIKLILPSVTIRHSLGEQGKVEDFLGYQEVYACYFTEFIAAVMGKNRNASFYLVEDGTGTYTGDILRNPFGKKYEIISRVLKLGYTLAKPKAIYVNNPDVCKAKIVAEIISLPACDIAFLQWARRVFIISSEGYYNKKLIWLTDVTDDNPKMMIVEDKCANILVNYHDIVLVRRHPREKTKWKYDYLSLDLSKDMWEIKISQEDLDKKILFALFSTAQFSPKYIFGKEPYLIFTYKVFPNIIVDKTEEEMDNMVMDLKKAYSEKSKVYIPRNMVELTSCVDELLETV